jgi:hypothetical protein
MEVSSFNVVSLFTRVMMREDLNLMSGHFKKKILALIWDVLHPSNFSFSGQPYKLVAFPCYCWLTEGLELKPFHHFTESVIWQYTSDTHPVHEHPSQYEGQAGQALLLLSGIAENPCCSE